MKFTVGIDIGGSTTKIVGFDEKGALISPMFVKAADPVTSVYGAFGKFTSDNGIDLSDVESVMITGVGSTYVKSPIYGLPCRYVSEFDSVGLGGLYLSQLDRAVIVSMGTGTSVTYGEKVGDGTRFEYLGGTGVGGGTIVGLSRLLLGVTSIDSIVELAETGDIEKIDLLIKDITNKDIHPGMNKDLTAANFGDVDELATREDIAAGLINLVFETAAMISLFAARTKSCNDIVITGNLTTILNCKDKFKALSEMFGVNFIIPDNSQYGTVIGAALLGRK